MRPVKRAISRAAKRAGSSNPSAAPRSSQQQKARPYQIELLFHRERPVMPGGSTGSIKVSVEKYTGCNLAHRCQMHMRQAAKPHQHCQKGPSHRDEAKESPQVKPLPIDRSVQQFRRNEIAAEHEE